MSDWRDRLRQILDERGLGAAEVSLQAGLSHSYLNQLLTRDHKPNLAKLSKIAAVLGVSLGELYEGADAVTQTVAIVGTVSGGEGWIAADDNLGEFEMRVEGGEPVALEVVGESMMPAYRPGDLLVGAKKGGDRASSLIGKDCIVMTDRGERYVKILMKGTIRGRYTLRSYNPLHQDILDVKIEWAAPIVWVKRK
jgi:phage repressor protein C with HTH and peptisase S24 domain